MKITENSIRASLKRIMRESKESDDGIAKETADALRKLQLWGDFGIAAEYSIDQEPPAEIFVGVPEEDRVAIIKGLRDAHKRWGFTEYDDDTIADWTSTILEQNGKPYDYKSAETDAYLTKLRKTYPAYPFFGSKLEACKGKKKKALTKESYTGKVYLYAGYYELFLSASKLDKPYTLQYVFPTPANAMEWLESKGADDRTYDAKFPTLGAVHPDTANAIYIDERIDSLNDALWVDGTGIFKVVNGKPEVIDDNKNNFWGESCGRKKKVAEAGETDKASVIRMFKSDYEKVFREMARLINWMEPNDIALSRKQLLELSDFAHNSIRDFDRTVDDIIDVIDE